GSLGGSGFQRLRISGMAEENLGFLVGFMPEQALAGLGEEPELPVPAVVFPQFQLVAEQVDEGWQGFLFEQRKGGTNNKVVAWTPALDFTEEPGRAKGGFAPLATCQDGHDAFFRIPSPLLAGMKVQPHFLAYELDKFARSRLRGLN